MMPRFASFLAILVLLILPVAAQSQLKGFAVAQAPEAGSGICFGSSATKTIKCAEDKCIKESGLSRSDCTANLWCYPHGWVVDIFMQHQEGPHWHKFVCNGADRAAIDAIVAFECRPDYLIECGPVRIWDFDGKEVPVTPPS